MASGTELAVRSTDGVEVRLLWHEADDSISVAVRDEKSGDAFELRVRNDNALDAFNHPYAYAAGRGLEFHAGERHPIYA